MDKNEKGCGGKHLCSSNHRPNQTHLSLEEGKEGASMLPTSLLSHLLFM